MLPGESIRGTNILEWLDGQRFEIWRSHYDHPEIPDGITVIGVTDGQPSMHYVDQRGVYRVYAVSLDQASWRYWRNASGRTSRSGSQARSAMTATRSGSRSAIERREYLGGRSRRSSSELQMGVSLDRAR